MKIVFDVETVGHDFETLDQFSQDYFLKFAENEEQIEEAKQSLNFFPLTAQIVAIGMLDVETEEGAVYYQNNNGEKEKFTEGKISYVSGSERDVLQQELLQPFVFLLLHFQPLQLLQIVSLLQQDLKHLKQLLLA